MKPAIFLVPAGLLMPLFLFTGCGSGDLQDASEFTARIEVCEDLLRERGTVIPYESVPVQLMASGDLLEIVETGEEVETGQILVRQDDQSHWESLEQIEMNHLVEEAELELREARRELTILEHEQSMAQARDQIRLAELELKRLDRGPDAVERRRMRIDLRLLEIDRDEARTALEKERDMLARDFVSPAAVESVERRLKLAQAAVEDQARRITIREQPPREDARLELERSIARHRNTIERGARALERRLAHADAEIERTRAQKLRRAYDMASVSNNIENSVVYAPTNGIMRLLEYRDWRAGGVWRDYRPGVMRHAFDRIGEILNPGRMQVSLMVHAADAMMLETNLMARVRLPAFPGKEFEGRVITVGGVARDRFEVAPRGFEDSRSGVPMLNAAVSLESDTINFRPGMSAEVEIIRLPAAPRLVVPFEAVAVGDGPDAWRIVVREPGHEARIRVVRGRPVGERWLWVEDGLDEGETVLTPFSETVLGRRRRG